MSKPLIPSWAKGELAGTFILVFFGCGSVASAVTTGAFSGVFQIAMVWGVGIATAIYLCGALSGAHLNPAVTIALAAFGRFPPQRVPGYILMQFLGAFGAAALLYSLYHDAIALMEASNGIVRGAAGSEASAMIFGEFFPNPGGKPLLNAAPLVSHLGAFFVELVGTAVLVLVIFCVTDEQNSSRPRILTALSIGLTVTCLICLFGPLTMAGFNPARDLAPRMFTYLAGWDTAAFSANGIGWLTVYVLAPIAGGLVGGLSYQTLFVQGYRQHAAPPVALEPAVPRQVELEAA